MEGVAGACLAERGCEGLGALEVGGAAVYVDWAAGICGVHKEVQPIERLVLALGY